ncbi:MAG TPA: hypothetical protein VN692_19090 [Steroidobacteraceae bacterium]|nr:hypothetical protein [Steroidobacteraceae bacterium]
MAAHGEGINVGVRHCVVIDDPLADGDLPHRVGIDQKPVPGEQEQRIDADADPQRQQAAQRECILGDFGDGQGHGEGGSFRDCASSAPPAEHAKA